MQQPAQNPTRRQPPVSESAEPRRGFMRRALTVVIGGIVSLFPLAAGLAVFFDPLRPRTTGKAPEIRVASLDALPADGVPRQLPAIVEHRVDAWVGFNNVP